MLITLSMNLGFAWGEQSVTGTAAVGFNRFDDRAAIIVETLPSVTGLVAWVDYVPVAIVTDTDTQKWRVNEPGYIPVYEEVP